MHRCDPGQVDRLGMFAQTHLSSSGWTRERILTETAFARNTVFCSAFHSSIVKVRFTRLFASCQRALYSLVDCMRSIAYNWCFVKRFSEEFLLTLRNHCRFAYERNRHPSQWLSPIKKGGRNTDQVFIALGRSDPVRSHINVAYIENTLSKAFIPCIAKTGARSH